MDRARVIMMTAKVWGMEGAAQLSTEAITAVARRVVRDIGDALVVFSQNERLHGLPLQKLANVLREAAKRRFLFVIRKEGIPIAVVVLHRAALPSEATSRNVVSSLTNTTDLETGPHLQILDLISMSRDDDPVLKEEAAAILAGFRAQIESEQLKSADNRTV